MRIQDKLLDFEILLAWVEESIPSVAIPCTCGADSLCRRCEAETIVQRHRDKQNQPLPDPVQIDPQPMNLDDLPF